MKKILAFIWLVLAGYLLIWLRLGQSMLVVMSVAVPAIVAAVCYPNWKETRAPGHEFLNFWLVASFLGVFPVFAKVFFWLYNEESVLNLGELLGGLAGVAYFLVTLLSSVGTPVLYYDPDVPKSLSEEQGTEELLAAVRQVTRRAGASLKGVYRVPARALAGEPVGFSGLGSTNLYLSEEAVERLSPSEIAFLVGANLWHLRHRDMWWNLVVYYVWILFVALHTVLGWAVVATVGGVTFSCIWPLASRLKRLVADRYAAKLTGGTEAGLSALTALPEVSATTAADPKGWSGLVKILFSHGTPLGVRLSALSLSVSGRSGPGDPELRFWRRETARFLLLQALLFVVVTILVLLPGWLSDGGALPSWGAEFLYLVLAGVLYAPFTWYTASFIYWNFLAPGDGAAQAPVPKWATVLPAALLASALVLTWLVGLGPVLFEVAVAASAGCLTAGLLVSEIEGYRRGRPAA